MEDAFQSLNEDKVESRYYPHFEALQEIRKFFLKNIKKYDYLVICSDDLVILPKDIMYLKNDLKTGKYKVISGMSNVDEKDWNDPEGYINISHKMPDKEKSTRVYELMKSSELPNEDIFTVMFSGFPLMAIHKSIAKDYPFYSDTLFKKGRRPNEGQQFDLVFCHHCNDNNIPVYVDQRIYMHHLRDSGTSQIKVKPAKTVFSEGKRTFD